MGEATRSLGQRIPEYSRRTLATRGPCPLLKSVVGTDHALYQWVPNDILVAKFREGDTCDILENRLRGGGRLRALGRSTDRCHR